MKIISVLTWSASHVAVALVYAGEASELGNKIGETELDAGSLAYLGDGSTYVFDGEIWNKVGA